VSAIASRQHEDANRRPARTAEIELPHQDAAGAANCAHDPAVAIPNTTVMLVQILIGLVEVYFVSRTGVDAPPASRRCFRWCRWWLPSPRVRSGAALSRRSHAPRPGRIGTASEYAWYAVAFGVSLGLATTAAPCLRWVQTSHGQMGVSGNALEIGCFLFYLLFLQVPR
jgi:hypothetical protein